MHARNEGNNCENACALRMQWQIWEMTLKKEHGHDNEQYNEQEYEHKHKRKCHNISDNEDKCVKLCGDRLCPLNSNHCALFEQQYVRTDKTSHSKS